MATIKSYTDLEQSKKLAEILSIESVDMCWTPFDEKWDAYLGAPNPDAIKKEIPCWSLAALLGVLPRYELNNFGDTIQLDINLEAFATEGDETLLDLVVNMIIHLHELNLL